MQSRLRQASSEPCPRTIISIAHVHLTEFWSRLQVELADYDANMQSLIADLHTENQTMRRNLKLPPTPLALLRKRADSHRSCCTPGWSAFKQQIAIPQCYLAPPSGPLQVDQGPVQPLDEMLERTSTVGNRHCSQVNSVQEPNGDASVDIPDSSEESAGGGPEGQRGQSGMFSSFGQTFILRSTWEEAMKKTSSNRSKLTRPSIAKVSPSGDAYEAHCSLHPTSHVAVAWNFLFMVMLSYELVVFPLKAFPLPDDGLLLVMTWVGIIFWTSDLFISMFMGFQNKSGKYVLKWSLIVRNYARTWMIPDFVMIAIDWASMLASDSGTEGTSLVRAGKTLRSIRVLQALRVLRLYKVRSMFRMSEVHLDSLYLRILSSILLNLMVILASSHFIGCLWYWVGTHMTDDGRSWVNTYLQNATWEYSYMTSYHWALTQFTPGSMDVHPQNMFERTFANLVLMLGLIIFSSSVSSITNATNRLRHLRSTYANLIWELRKFFKQENISSMLLYRVTKYSDAVIAPRVDHISMHDVALFKLLPHTIRKEVTREIYERHITRHPFFKAYSHLDGEAMQCLYNHLTQEALAEEDVLFSAGQTAYNMYFFITGRLKYLMIHADEEENMGVFAGMWCSEAALWTHWFHQGSMQCEQASDVVLLNADLFAKDMCEQRHLHLVTIYANFFIESMNAISVPEIEDNGSCQSPSVLEKHILSDLHRPPDMQKVSSHLFKRSRSRSSSLG